MVWLSAVIWIDRSTRAQVENVLDARLREAAGMVSSLLSDHRIALDAASPGAPIELPLQAGYHRELSCQIWSLDDTLVGQSSGAPSAPLAASEATGFAETMVDGERWRTYTAVNAALGLRVTVGDSLAVRDGLVRGVISGLAWPAAVALPVMALVLWLATAQGLAPLNRFATALRARSATDLSPLDPAPVPREIRPVRAALDALFARVQALRERERDFIAYAAHEMKTPLAGIRMQAQIAQRAEDAATRDHALEELERSVTRTDRMVRQLLELASVEETEGAGEPSTPEAVLRTVTQELTPTAEARGVALSCTATGAPAEPRDAMLLHLALRNLVENALQATPPGGAVEIALRPERDGPVIDIRDGGAGIPEALRGRETDKFVKASGGEGSGLGLAITAQALTRLGATLRFRMQPDGHHAIVQLEGSGPRETRDPGPG